MSAAGPRTQRGLRASIPSTRANPPRGGGPNPKGLSRRRGGRVAERSASEMSWMVAALAAVSLGVSLATLRAVLAGGAYHQHDATSRGGALGDIARAARAPTAQARGAAHAGEEARVAVLDDGRRGASAGARRPSGSKGRARSERPGSRPPWWLRSRQPDPCGVRGLRTAATCQSRAS
jgi:hypothetical protein